MGQPCNVGPQGEAGGRLPCLPTWGRKHVVEGMNYGLLAQPEGSFARPAGLAQLGPKGSGCTRFLPALALSPKYGVSPASPGCSPVTELTEMVLSCFPAEEWELAWVKTGNRYQAGSPSRDHRGPAGGKGPGLAGGRDPEASCPV